MKRAWFIGALIVLAMVVLLLFTAPGGFPQSSSFKEAKIIALTAKPDANGNFFISKNKSSGLQVAVGYLPQQKYIGLMVTDPEGIRIVVVYDESDGRYEGGIYQNGQQVGHWNLTEEQAEKIACKILEDFRVMI